MHDHDPTQTAAGVPETPSACPTASDAPDQRRAWIAYLDAYEQLFDRRPLWLACGDRPTSMWEALTADLLDQRDAILAPAPRMTEDDLVNDAEDGTSPQRAR